MTSLSDPAMLRDTVLNAIGRGASDEKEQDPFKLVVYHIGGDGGLGPVTEIIKTFGRDCLIVVFDVREDISDIVSESTESQSDPAKIVINIGVAGETGRSQFHVNVFPLSSCIRAPAVGALGDHCLNFSLKPPYEQITTWAQNTELDSLIEIDTVSIDDLVKTGVVPPPDIISLDAQGSDFDILHGASQTIADDMVCVITEAMFFEYYEGERLFGDVFNLITGKGFRFADLLTRVYSHPSEATGVGLLTGTEALFLRHVKTGFADHYSGDIIFAKLSKLARVSYVLNRYSFTNTVLAHLENEYPKEFNGLRERNGYGDLLAKYDEVKSHKDEYDKDFYFFLRSEYRSSRPSLPKRLMRSIWHILPDRARYALRQRTLAVPAPSHSPLIFHEDPIRPA